MQPVVGGKHGLLACWVTGYLKGPCCRHARQVLRQNSKSRSRERGGGGKVSKTKDMLVQSEEGVGGGGDCFNSQYQCWAFHAKNTIKSIISIFIMRQRTDDLDNLRVNQE